MSSLFASAAIHVWYEGLLQLVAGQLFSTIALGMDAPNGACFP